MLRILYLFFEILLGSEQLQIMKERDETCLVGLVSSRFLIMRPFTRFPSGDPLATIRRTRLSIDFSHQTSQDFLHPDGDHKASDPMP